MKKKEINIPLVAALIGAAILLVTAVGGYTGSAITGKLYTPDLKCKLAIENSVSVNELAIKIYNRGGAPAGAFSYVLYDGAVLWESGKIDALASEPKSWIKSLKDLSAGKHTISLNLDVENSVVEINEGNNVCTTALTVE